MKKIILLLICSVLTIIGCGNIDKDAVANSALHKSTLDSFGEIPINIPENMESTSMICLLEDKSTLRLSSTVMEGDKLAGKVWETKDMGEKWELIFDTTQVSNNVYSYIDIALDDSGDLAFYGVIQEDALDIEHSHEHQKNDSDSEDVLYYVKESDTKAEILNILPSEVNGILGIEFAPDGDLYVQDFDFNIYKFEEGYANVTMVLDDEVTADMDQYGGFVVTENYMIVNFVDEIVIHDIESNEIQRDMELAKFINGDLGILGGMEYYAGDSLLCVNEKGIWLYDIQEKMERNIAGPGQLITRGTLDYSLAVVNESEFYCLSTTDFYKPGKIYRCMDRELIEYTEQIHVYALIGSGSILNVLDAWRMAYPNVEFVVEIGLPTDGNLEVEDAIRNLNIALEAGNGPDILFLHGLDEEIYLDEEILLNLKELYTEHNTGDQFENIALAYEEGDYLGAIPHGFSMPVIIETMDGKEIETVDDVIKQTQEDTEQKSYEEKYPHATFSAIETMMYGTMNDWIRNNEVNEDAVREYFEFVEAMYNDGSYKNWENMKYTLTGMREYDYEELKEDVFNRIHIGMDVSFELAVTDKREMLLQVVKNAYDLMALYTMELENNEIEYQLFNIGNGNVFIPEALVGIPNKSENQELAKDLLVYTLFEWEPIDESSSDGIKLSFLSMRKSVLNQQVNASVIEPNYAILPDPNASEMWILQALNEDQLTAFYDRIERLQIATTIPEDIYNLVIIETTDILLGKTTGKEAADKMIQRLQLENIE